MAKPDKNAGKANGRRDSVDSDTSDTSDTSDIEFEIPTPPEGGFGWVIVVMSFVIHIVIDGVVYAFGVFFMDIVEYFDSSRGEAAWIASVLVGVTFFSGPLASAAISRLGCQVVCVAGSWICGIAFALSFFAPNIPFLVGTIGVLGGLGMGMLYLPAIAIIAMYFEERRSLAIGLAVCGSGVGTFVFGVVGVVLVKQYAWQGGLLITGGLLINCSVFGAFFRPLRATRVTHPADDAHVASESEEPDSRLLQKIPENHVHNGNGTTPEVKAQRARLFASEPNMNIRRVSLAPQLTTRTIKSMTHLDKAEVTVHVQATKKHLENPMTRLDALYPRNLQQMPGYSHNRNAYVTSALTLMSVPMSVKSRKPKCCSSIVETLKADFGGFYLLKNWAFVLFIASNILTSIGFNAPFLFIPDLAIDMEFSKEYAGYLVSIMGATNTVGRVLFGYICDKWKFKENRELVEGTAIIIAGAAVAACPLYKSYGALCFMAATFGFGASAFVTLTPLVAVDALGKNDPDTFNKAYGITLLFQGISTFIGPPIAGWIYDWLHSYSYSFLFTGAVVALSGALLFGIKPIKRLQGKVQSREGNELESMP